MVTAWLEDDTIPIGVPRYNARSRAVRVQRDPLPVLLGAYAAPRHWLTPKLSATVSVAISGAHRGERYTRTLSQSQHAIRRELEGRMPFSIADVAYSCFGASTIAVWRLLKITTTHLTHPHCQIPLTP